MVNRATRLRWRRRIRRKQRQVEDVGAQAEAGLEQHFFKRLSRLTRVRRFVVSWLLLLAIATFGSVIQLRSLSPYFQESEPAPGGVFTEGIVGTFTTANPLYATTSADSAVSRLVFSGLMQYDENNNLVEDLAESRIIDQRGVRYEIKLRQDVRWHDGEPLTAHDVVFTYQTIQNPDARSPLFASWRDVKVEAPDDYTVVFTLPNALTSFDHSLTNGIVPAHLLANVPVTELRSNRFNAGSPVGSGPFAWDALEVVGVKQEEREERIGLMSNQLYHKGAPKLQRFIVRTFRDAQAMRGAYDRGALNAMVGLMDIPDELAADSKITDFNIPLAAEVMTFFNTKLAPLDDPVVRRALTQAVDVSAVSQTLGYPVIAAKGPLLTSQINYGSDLAQLPFNLTDAARSLDEAGWLVGRGGIRQKGDQRLAFTVQAQNTGDYVALTNFLQTAWQKLGVEVEVLLQSDAEVQGSVRRHGYQALLYGIAVSRDPDVFAYWHSSQADPNSTYLNLSEYSSTAADRALEEGRIRSDATARAARYRSFLAAWRTDAPALALYQPRFLYVVRGDLFNFKPKLLGSPIDRYANVQNWMIRSEKVVKQ